MSQSTLFSPKYFVNDGSPAPDRWDLSRGLIPIDNMVVSRAKDGQILSRYGDGFWDLTPYYGRGDFTCLYFYVFDDESVAGTESLVAEMRYFLFLLMYARPGVRLSLSSLRNYLNMLRSVAVFAFNKKCSLKDVLSSKPRLAEYAYAEPIKGKLTMLAALLSFLLKLGAEKIGFLVVGKSGQDVLLACIQLKGDTGKQYPPIPTRIYSLLISALDSELKDWEAVEQRYLSLLRECLGDPILGKSKRQQITIATRHGIARTPGEYKDDFTKLLSNYRLKEYFDINNLSYSVHGLVFGLSSVMNVAKLYIITFSGMRNAEARYLPFNCIDEERSLGGVVHRLIQGNTTKLKKVRTKWVTNSEGYRAIRIVQRISKVIYAHLGEVPSITKKPDDDFPLFVTTAYLNFTGRNTRRAGKTFQALGNSFFSTKFVELRKRVCPLIEDGDLKELEHIDPHRAWRSEAEFQVGVPWPLTEHMLRRSLALYAQRSGLVSLSSLRRQLQHLTEEMSRYYARGSMYAKNFIGDDKEHFGLEWQEAGPVASGLAFIRDVLFPDEPIFGGYVKWIEHRVGGAEGQIILDRETTLRRFRNGELAYKETPIGGCTKVGPCDELAIRFLDVDCLGGCPNLVGRLSKLEQVIKGQTALVSRLRPDSIEWKIEKADLDVLQETRARVLQQRGEVK